ncbi:antimicrobial peptide NK-lysin [Hippoglossus hippoglossus]|uniref:antimicrobial peptide NK-lysin n=1 Tax=Hippoglossus hippoglossus TaxID=8267 RepID=UPI00148B9552|nr:antimicrobial peptide NK-lysin [Hippoglossus hippoglossus]
MAPSSILLLGILVTCSVWTVKGRSFEIHIDDQEQVDVEISVDAGKIPGKCWACKWALKKVKRVIGPNATAEAVKSQLNSICNEIGLLKSVCRKFVKVHLGELIEELTTTDDVETICVNAGACKPKEVSHLLFYPKQEESQTEMNEYP